MFDFRLSTAKPQPCDDCDLKIVARVEPLVSFRSSVVNSLRFDGVEGDDKVSKGLEFLGNRFAMSLDTIQECMPSSFSQTTVVV